MGATGTGRFRDRLRANKVSAVLEVKGETGPFSSLELSRKFLDKDFFQCLVGLGRLGSGLFMSLMTKDKGLS